MKSGKTYLALSVFVMFAASAFGQTQPQSASRDVDAAVAELDARWQMVSPTPSNYLPGTNLPLTLAVVENYKHIGHALDKKLSEPVLAQPEASPGNLKRWNLFVIALMLATVAFTFWRAIRVSRHF